MSYSLARQLRRATFASRQLRWESTLRNPTQEEIDLQPPFAHWSKVIREAEKIVGYPTSFMNLRWLLSDEFANMALHLRKLVGSDHPLLTTAKSLLYSEHNNLQPWGLVILLLSKAVKNSSDPSELSSDNEVYENQRILAELTEMIRTGHLIHKGLLNIPIAERKNKTETTIFGNKIGILIGDYLLVTANGMLAKLRNQDLSYIISSALRDLSEGEFFGDRDTQNNPLPGNPVSRITRPDTYAISSDTAPICIEEVLGSPRREWTVRAMYGGGSLLGRGCHGAMLLARESEQCQEKAYLFGCHVGLAWQAATELQRLTTNTKDFSLVSAPVLFALNEKPELYEFIELAKVDVSNLDLDEFKRKVLETDAAERTRLLHEEHTQKAMELIASIGSNESVEAMKKIITTL